MLHDHEAAVGRQHYPVRRESGVRNPVALPVQLCNGRRQLPNETRGEGRMHAGPRLGTPEDLRQALARGERGHERQVAVAQTLDRAHSRKRGMVECAERVDALAKGVLEPARCRQQRPEAEQFERRVSAVVEHPQPIPDAIGDTFGVPARQRLRRVGTVPSVDGGAVTRCHRAVHSIVQQTLRAYKAEMRG